MNAEDLKLELADIDPLCAEHDSIVDLLDAKTAQLAALLEKVRAYETASTALIEAPQDLTLDMEQLFFEAEQDMLAFARSLSV